MDPGSVRRVFLLRWMRCFRLLYSRTDTASSLLWTGRGRLDHSVHVQVLRCPHFQMSAREELALRRSHPEALTEPARDCIYSPSFPTCTRRAVLRVCARASAAFTDAVTDLPPAATLLPHVSGASVGGQLNGICLSAPGCSRHASSPSSAAFGTQVDVPGVEGARRSTRQLPG